MILKKEAYKEVVEKNEKLKVSGLRIVRNMKIGQYYRQGDILVHRVADNHPHGKRLSHNQLAVGSTLGSRHFADENFECYEGTTPPPTVINKRGYTVFLGPLLKSKSNIAMNTHPEHCNFCPGEGTYQVTHEIDLRTLQRVRD